MHLAVCLTAMRSDPLEAIRLLNHHKAICRWDEARFPIRDANNTTNSMQQTCIFRYPYGGYSHEQKTRLPVYQ